MEPINRKLLKENAKKTLKRNFWLVMLICFCASFLGGNFNGLNAGSNTGSSVSSSVSNTLQSTSSRRNVYGDTDFFGDFNGKTIDSDDIKDALDEIGEDIEDTFDDLFDDFGNSFHNLESVQVICLFVAVLCFVILLVYLLAMTISFLIGSFLGAPVGVGYRRFFMLNRLGKGTFTDLFAAFSGGRYMKIVKTMFKTNIEMYLWRLLFYFPGVVKSYQYYFVGYIMAENPNIDSKRARELSKQMTKGHKWQIFVLELSFIGWIMVFLLEIIFLAVISCGLLAIPGTLLIYPLVGYEMATYAELYEERREYALMTGMASKEELVGFDFGA